VQMVMKIVMTMTSTCLHS